ncbi:hypothetical protein MalM25_08990 [Planctomycetes bacterium MalM25]|nr:hypothetical protein MalM25_08990 [Planctomycetes bacterium MalM25]
MTVADEHSEQPRISTTALAAGVGAVVVLITLAALVRWLAFGSTARVEPTFPVSETVVETEPDEATKSALLVLEGATQLRRDPGAYGSHHVAYALNEKHPASIAIQQISSNLKKLGWMPIQDDWLNPGIPSSHLRGWTDFRDGTTTPMNRVHRWGAQWQDKTGNVVDYTLSYTYPVSGVPDLHSLWINGSWYPAASVKIMQTR